MIAIHSARLQLGQFQMTDAQDVFGCITPSIARFMPWEPPSWNEYVARCEKRVQAPDPNTFSFVIRRLDNKECLGMASFEDVASVSPEVGLWLKESAHGQGFGREVVVALVEWDMQFTTKEVPPTRWLYKISPAGVSPKGFTAGSWASARIRNTNPSFTEFPFANKLLRLIFDQHNIRVRVAAHECELLAVE